MANVFKCDICGKETSLYPPYRHKYEEKDINGVKTKIPAMKSVKKQNFHTGKIESVEVPDIEYEKPVTIIVKLQVGGQEIQKDFCDECVKNIMPEITTFWDVLERIESK